MASIGRDPNGYRRILFVAPDGRRKTIRLGKATQRTAEAVKVRVEALVSAQLSGQSPDDETSRWIAALDTTMADKLAAVGLIAQRETAVLASYIDAYIAKRSDVKPLTIKKYRSARKVLVSYFGADRRLRDISIGNAEDWRLQLLERKLAENTVRKYTAVAKLFFGDAVKKNLISSNPFSGLKATILPNRERFYFVTREEAEKVIAACPDSEWRLIVALARYGGFRCPSEHLSLHWRDIDWANSRIRVTSPKTAHHIGGDSRMVPLFPELRPHLEAMFDEAPEGAEYVLTDRYRSMKTFDLINFRSRLLDIIAAAGLKPWVKVFQNMRSTRQTELSEIFPSHVVCAWLGNSEAVAAKHYLQVTDEHFAKALRCAAQIPAQYPSVLASQSLQNNHKTPVIAESYVEILNCTNFHVAEAGLEPARAIKPTGF
jgi:integrase